MVAARTLPTPPAPLIGRSEDLRTLCELITAPGMRLATITGPPGVGKTRLALEVARSTAEKFVDGAAWVDLSALRDGDSLVPEIVAAAAGGLDGAHRRRRLPRIDRDVLVVIDNCEHLLDAMPALGELLADSPGLRLLATSRERLRLSAEREYSLPPLPMPSEVDIADPARLARVPAIALLLARAPANVRLTSQTARPLTEVCTRLDGLPLALELAAARLRVFTPGELAFRLDRRMSVLTAGSRDAPARHRDLWSALAWSHDLLPELEREAFRRLSLIVGDWTLDTAEAMCANDAVAAVESLVEKNLVRRVDRPGGVGTFGMLASLREFAAEQLAAHGEIAETAARHRGYFAGRARHWESTVGTESEIRAWTDLGALHGDLRVALASAESVGETETALWLATGLGWYGYTRGSLSGGSRLLDVITAGVDQCRNRDATAAACIAAGVVALGVGELDRAEQSLHSAVQLCESDNDDRRIAIAAAFRGHVAREQGRLDEAAGHYTMARTIFESLENRHGTAWAAHDLGVLDLERGDLVAAESLLREALSLFREVDYEWAIAVCASALGTVLTHAGRMDEPALLFGEALALHDRLGEQRGLARCLEGLAQVEIARGAAATAARLRGAALAQRTAAMSRPSDWEQVQLARLDAGIAAALGRAGAEHDVHAGRTMPVAVALRLAAEVATRDRGGPAGGDVELTQRQREVAARIAAGSTNRQIARALGISEKTVEVHVRNIMERLRMPSRAGVAAWATAHGLRTPS